jgi:hypothetical protein
MIQPSAPSFYVIQATGEAAELIASVFSESAMSDIENVTVLSKQYTNDIEPMNELDSTLETLKDGLGIELDETVKFNPLYFPMSLDVLAESLESDPKSDKVRFNAMRGNPYAVKIVEINADESPLIVGSVSYQPFELPAYEDIMNKQLEPMVN